MRIMTALLVAGMAETGLASASMAGEAHLATIEQECRTQLGYSPARCNCVQETAASQLDDKQQAFVAAQVAKDQAAIAAVQGGMTMDEMLAAGVFMTNVFNTCS